jgi:hypothetical protein
MSWGYNEVVVATVGANLGAHERGEVARDIDAVCSLD